MTVKELEIPAVLPVANLSPSSVRLFLTCPEKWRRRYLENEYEPPSGKMILGSAVGAAEGHAYQAQLDTGERPGTEQNLDSFSDEFDYRVEREDIDWGRDDPAALKDSGVKSIEAYDQTIAPAVTPVSVEREFTVRFEGVEWGLRGFLDVEDDQDHVIDLKVRGQKLSPADADADLQATSYLLARRAEGSPASAFQFHTMVRVKQPYAEIVPTVRTDDQLDWFADRVLRIAAEMQWRIDTDNWSYAAPGHWACGERMCGFWHSCPGGGLR